MRFLRFMSTPSGRIIRVVVGGALIGAGFVVGGPIGRGLGIFGLLPVATGATGICPLNPLVGSPLRGCRATGPSSSRLSAYTDIVRNE